MTVVALTPVMLVNLDRRSFRDLPQHHPLVVTRLISLLVSRQAPYKRLVLS